MSEATQASCTSKQTRRSKILETAEACVGVKYKHQGRNPAIGLDCLGLAIYCAKEAGYTQIPDDRTYNPRVTSHDLRGTLNSYCRKKPRSCIMPGDLVLLRTGMEPVARHLGVFTGDFVIHATIRHRRVVKEPYEFMEPSIVGVYEYPEVDGDV